MLSWSSSNLHYSTACNVDMLEAMHVEDIDTADSTDKINT